MKLATLIALATLVFGSIANAQERESVPAEFGGILGLQCTATVGGKTVNVVTAKYGNKGVEAVVQNVDDKNVAPKYRMNIAIQRHSSMEFFFVGVPPMTGIEDERINDLFIRINTDGSSRLAIGYEFENLKDLSCDFDFAG